MLARGEAVCSLIHLYFHWEDILIFENMNEEKLAKMNQTYEESYTQFISVLLSLMKVL